MSYLLAISDRDLVDNNDRDLLVINEIDLLDNNDRDLLVINERDLLDNNDRYLLDNNNIDLLDKNERDMLANNDIDLLDNNKGDLLDNNDRDRLVINDRDLLVINDSSLWVNIVTLNRRHVEHKVPLWYLCFRPCQNSSRPAKPGPPGLFSVVCTGFRISPDSSSVYHSQYADYLNKIYELVFEPRFNHKLGE